MKVKIYLVPSHQFEIKLFLFCMYTNIKMNGIVHIFVYL